MKVLCDTLGLVQLVRKPTRQEYLLDLFISDMPECRISVLPSIADHCAVLGEVPLLQVSVKTVSRYSWKLGEAKWDDLEVELQSIDWHLLSKGTSEDALTYFLEMLGLCLRKFIPYRKVTEKKQSHPWLNARCENAISKKNAAEGTPEFDAMQKICSRVLAEEYHKHLEELRKKIAGMKRWSKQWWRLNRQLLKKKAKLGSIPPPERKQRMDIRPERKN